MPSRRFKGGISSYDKVRRDIRNVLNDQQAIVTTMIDFYGLPNDFPQISNLPSTNGIENAHFLEQAFTEDIGNQRFRPFLAVHEYEALLFSDPAQIAHAFPEQNILEFLQRIRNSVNSPEEINHGRETHPAARIKTHISGYRKPLHGTLIAKRIGLTKIRSQCSHFAEWLTWLESLGNREV